MKKGNSDDGIVYHAGFPNAGEDQQSILSLDELVVKNRSSTFFWRLSGDIDELQLKSGAILVVDRSLRPRDNDLVVVVVDDEFTVCRYLHTKFYRLDGSMETASEISLWGTITYTLQRYR